MFDKTIQNEILSIGLSNYRKFNSPKVEILFKGNKQDYLDTLENMKQNGLISSYNPSLGMAYAFLSEQGLDFAGNQPL